MISKVLSIKQPYASLICYGIKTVKNRTWKTDYRGKLLIHASGNNMSFFNMEAMPQKFMNEWYDYIEKDEWNCPESAPESIKNAYKMAKDIWNFYGISQNEPRPVNEWVKQAVKDYGFFYKSQTIIGECQLVDIVRNSKDDFAEPDCYHWILAEPCIYDKPITNVLGHLRLWDFEK